MYARAKTIMSRRIGIPGTPSLGLERVGITSPVLQPICHLLSIDLRLAFRDSRRPEPCDLFTQTSCVRLAKGCKGCWGYVSRGTVSRPGGDIESAWGWMHEPSAEDLGPDRSLSGKAQNAIGTPRWALSVFLISWIVCLLSAVKQAFSLKRSARS